MFKKRAVLFLVAIALFATAALSVGTIDPDAACAERNAGSDGSEGSTLELRFAYDRLDLE